jgi:hypothetical protein
LIIRRVPGNIVGPLLIVWSGTVAFSASLRDKVDINSLENSILEVVKETMQPVSSTLWLHHSNQQPGQGNLRIKSAQTSS